MRGIKTFQRKLEKTLRKIPLLKPGQSVLVGVSGGADSCSLLFSLLESEYGFKIYVAHFDHEIRPESGEDREFVSRLCAQLNLPFYSAKGKVLERKEKESLSLEEACRLERMDFLFRLKDELALDWIALGHTADDQVETILWRLINGAGTDGLKGIPLYDERRGAIHPLLFHWHEETVNYCRERGIQFREDPTNYQPINPRNILRNRLLPEILNYFPQAKEGILRSSMVLEGENRYLLEQAKSLLPEVVKKEGDSLLISLKLKDYPVALERRVIQLLLQEKFNQASFQEIESIRELLSKNVGKRFLLGDFEVVRGYRFLELRKQELVTFQDFETALNPPISLTLPDGRKIVAQWIEKKMVDFKPGHSFLDTKGIRKLTLRFWKPGDLFRPLGSKFEKKLQDFFVDRKIPREKRLSWPLISVGKEIACIVGLEVSDSFKISEETKEALHVYILEEDKNERAHREDID
ncbi:MAG: tRNA lysidine(34) synthetase TilS [bacterium]